jgi:hypothetical protein
LSSVNLLWHAFIAWWLDSSIVASPFEPKHHQLV